VDNLNLSTESKNDKGGFPPRRDGYAHPSLLGGTRPTKMARFLRFTEWSGELAMNVPLRLCKRCEAKAGIVRQVL
jgi:hypothetical protein